MDKLDNDLKQLKWVFPKEYSEQHYKEFGYDDVDEMMLDLDLLLSVKYKHIQRLHKYNID